MSAAPAPRSSRLWIPVAVLLVAPAAGALVWYWPGDWEHALRTVTLMGLGAVALLLLALWLLFLSRFPGRVRLGLLALLVGGGAALAGSVREVRFSGDMVPAFTFRWEKSADDLLEEDRKSRAADTADAPAEGGRAGIHLICSNFFGYTRDGIVSDSELEPDWSAKPPKQLWRQPAGGGYSGFALREGLAVTIEQRRGEEAVVCYEAASGRERWVHKYAAHFQEPLGGPGPRATPAVADVATGPRKGSWGHKVYSLGAEGRLKCLDLKTGEEGWSANILAGNANLPWGMAASPLVHLEHVADELEPRIIVAPGVQADGAKGRGVLVYDAKTGKELRAFGNRQGAYSSPVIGKLCGGEQLLVLGGDGLTGYDPTAGRELWHHPWVAHPPQNINVAQPLVLDGDRVLISSGYDVGCAMLRVRKDGPPEVLWQNKLMRCKFTSPVHRDGYLYGLDEGILACLDARTGERRWRDGRYGHGQLLLADRHLLILSERGDLVLVEATPERHNELGRVTALKGKTWNPPALSACFAFVRNDKEMAAYALPGKIVPDPAIRQIPTD
jgi:outer membrane protein assembly factor BamB